MRSLLYDQPRLYDLVFPDAGETELEMCLEAFRRWGPASPQSALDLGCGTAMNLERLARTIPECWGIDFLEANVSYARSVRPHLNVRQGDFRSVRLGRTFDAVMCFGNALSYALTDDDLRRTAETFAVHAGQGSLLALDVLNARSYLKGDGFQERIEGRVDAPEFTATSVSVHSLDRDRRLLRRTRTWHIPGRPDVVDQAEYRLLDPDELRRLITDAGFEWLAVYDNREFRDSDLGGAIGSGQDCAGMRGRKLYAFARKPR